MMSDGLSPRRARLLGIGLLALTFVVGGLTGAAADRVLIARPADDAARAEAPREADAREKKSRDESRGGRRADIFDQLGLSTEQRSHVDVVLARRNAEIEAFWDEAGPRLRAIVDTTRAEIRAVLTPAQEDDYDRLRKERRRNRCERSDDDEREEQQ